MDIILLERVAKLGQMGDVVSVRDGYARNFLLPQGKAMRSTEANRKRFESQRSDLEARNLERRSEAEQVAVKLDGKSFIVVRQAGETGQLYGSVSTRDLVDILDGAGFKVGRNQIELDQPIKAIGLHKVIVALHADVETSITINVARSEDEATRQARGEDLTARVADEVFETYQEEGGEEYESERAEAGEAEMSADGASAEEPEAAGQ